MAITSPAGSRIHTIGDKLKNKKRIQGRKKIVLAVPSAIGMKRSNEKEHFPSLKFHHSRLLESDTLAAGWESAGARPCVWAGPAATAGVRDPMSRGAAFLFLLKRQGLADT